MLGLVGPFGLVSREFVELIPDAAIIVDEDGVVVQANSHAEEMFAVEPGALEGVPVDSLIPDDLRERHALHRTRYQRYPRRRTMGAGLELRARRSTGEQFPVEVSLSPVDVAGRQLVVAAIRDVTDRHAALDALRDSEQRFRRVFDDAPIGMALVRLPEGTVATANAHLADIARRGGLALEGMAATDLVHAVDRARLATSIAELASGRNTAVLECRLAADDGDQRWARITASHLTGHEGSAPRIVLQVEDISEARAVEKRLEHLALHDELTGLPNRALALDRVRQALAAAERRGQWLGLAFLDLDNFKDVNDSLGHDAGDELLRQVARRLSAALRPSDTAARFGGDEFVVCLPDLGVNAGVAEAQALAVVERITTALRAPFRVDGETIQTDASCGLALAGGPTRAEALLRDADTAMYRAKEAGRGRTVVFDTTLRDRAMARLSIESQLRQAVGAGELVLHYQPVVDLATGQVVSAEALLRWAEPGGELRAPGEFLDVAEDSGLILPIGEWVLRQVCADLPALERRFGPGLGPVGINVSVRQLQRYDFAGRVAATASDASVEPARLAVEIAEHQLPELADSVRKQLAELDELGVGITLDDFGTGHGSLSYLRRLPVRTVKLDRAFVAGLGSAEDLAVARAVATLAEALGMASVAVGVETDGQAAAATGIGVRLAQGFRFGRPAPL